MSVNVLYRTEATATGGRDGHSATADGAVDVKLVTPKELGGAGGDGVNPEQLFATGYAACFLGAMKYAAGQMKVKVAPESSVTAAVGIGPRSDGEGFGLEVELKVSLPGLDPAVAEEVMRKGDIVCPYSHATRGNIKVTLTRV
jgi:Ohr subfamily peroxiredoxin